MTRETAPAAGAGDGSEHGRNAGWSTFRMRSAGQRKKARGSQRKSLKTLNPDKGVKGNQSLFLGFIWFGLGWIWLDLAKFGIGLD